MREEQEVPAEQPTCDPADTFDQKQLLRVLMAVKKGDFSVRMPADLTGTAGKIADTLNNIIDLNQHLASEFTRTGNVVGKEGKTSERAQPGPSGGAWATCIEAVNTLTSDLVQPTSEVARVIGAVAQGDLHQTVPLELAGRPLHGEFKRTATLVSTILGQLNSFAFEVTRVACEVGTEGKLGGQADVIGMAGTWKDLTDNVNQLAANLTTHIRTIAEIPTAVTKGDLTRSIAVEAQGEVAQLKDNVN